MSSFMNIKDDACMIRCFSVFFMFYSFASGLIDKDCTEFLKLVHWWFIFDQIDLTGESE